MRLSLPPTAAGNDRLHVSAARSRRAGGVVLDVDLSQARCNWRCVYCDVPELARGEGPELDVDLLRSEFESALDAVTAMDGGPASAADLAGVLFSGTGEPTQNHQFPDAVEAVATVMEARGLAGAVTPILLTNGSRCSDRRVRIGLQRIADLGGQTWFKLDSATREGQKALCDSDLILRHVRNYMKVAAEAMPTYLQTCVFQRDGAPSLDEAEREAYVGFVRNQLAARLPLAGVQLYAPNRRSAVEGERVGAPEGGWVEAFAESLGALLPVTLHL